jgi:hypothetical protein
MLYTVWVMTKGINTMTDGYEEEDGSKHINNSDLKMLRIAPLIIYAIAYPLHMLLKEFIL